ncbi:MAG: M48 family metallopeptidase [Thermodesulfobacteriota bacterium]
MKTDWKGHYFDGKSAVKHEVSINLSEDAVIINLRNEKFEWNINDCHIVDDISIDDYARIENLRDKNQKLVIYDSDFIQLLRSKFSFKKKLSRNSLLSSNLRKYAAIGFLFILIASPFIYFFVLPKISDFAAEKMPLWFEKRLAENYYQILAPEKSRCNDKERLEKLNFIINKLLESSPDNRYSFTLTVIKSDIVNAFALPGGDIVFYSGLIKKTKTPDQVAGVMAHELQHVLKRHGTKGLVKQLSFDIILSALTGSSDGGNAAIGAVKLAGLFKYSRDFEEEADKEGIKMMIESRIDPNGMVEFFDIMNKLTGEIPGYLKYFSTHPQTESRIETLQNYAKSFSEKPQKLFTDKEWEDIKKICDDESVEKFKGFGLN